jgi:hypothetical protein
MRGVLEASELIPVVPDGRFHHSAAHLLLSEQLRAELYIYLNRMIMSATQEKRQNL